MSALGHKGKSSQRAYSVRPTFQERTSLMRSGTSDLCHAPAYAVQQRQRLFDHLVAAKNTRTSVSRHCSASTFPSIGSITASVRLLNTVMTSGENASNSETAVR